MNIDCSKFDIPFIYDKTIKGLCLPESGIGEDLEILKNSKESRSILFYIIYKMLNNKNFDIKVTEFGKPYLANYPNIHFNISHSGDKIIFILCQRSVGIDIEIVKDINLGGKDRFFSKGEWNYILSSGNILSAFYEIWTLKEAYVKYLGIGLNKPLKTISIHVVGNNKYIVCDNEDNLKLIFNSFEIFDKFKYRVAICSENEVSSCVINLNKIEWKR